MLQIEKFNPKRLCAILVKDLQSKDSGGWRQVSYKFILEFNLCLYSCSLKYPAGSRTATQNVKVIPTTGNL